MDTSIVGFHKCFYIPEMHKLPLQLPHVQIFETHHCGNTHQEAFNCHSFYQDIFFRQYYTEYVVASFHTKFNLNNMVVIDMCILKIFH